MPGLGDLPVELLYKLQLHALSDTFPHVSRHFYRVFKSAPPSFHAEYILGRAAGGNVVTKALRYPLCTMEVFDALCRHADRHGPSLKLHTPVLPERLFRSLRPTGGASAWTDHDHPLPFLKYLYNNPSILAPNVCSDNGYALMNATKAAFIPLIAFLLDNIGGMIFEAKPLCYAAAEGDVVLVELLLARGAVYVNSRGRSGRTPLWHAAANGRTAVAALLLARGDVDANLEDAYGWTPLLCAAANGHADVVGLLLARDGIKVNLRDYLGYAPEIWDGAVRDLLTRSGHTPEIGLRGIELVTSDDD